MSDFTQFKAINSKLKKRFLLRKPNFSEASQQFSDLSQDCKEFKVSGSITTESSDILLPI